MQEIREKYIERIYELKQKNGYVRATDLAKLLKVKPPSVTEMLQKLSKEGYVLYEKYRVVDLTPKGMELAKKLEKRHRAIKKVFMYFGVDEETADKDACVVEHILSEETIEKIQKFAEKI
ncbi:MAG: metal-dependent transcriptional regulator [Thermoplasmata archaeon]|nr:metal-dependent transcriptional regulator [Thermoplasmata archaeon]